MPRRPFQVLEHADPTNAITLRHGHFFGKAPLRLGDKASLVPANDIAADRDPAPATLAGDKCLTIAEIEVGHLIKRNRQAGLVIDRQPADGFGRAEKLAAKARNDVKPPLSFVKRADRLAAKRRVDQLIDVADVDVVA